MLGLDIVSVMNSQKCNWLDHPDPPRMLAYRLDLESPRYQSGSEASRHRRSLQNLVNLIVKNYIVQQMRDSSVLACRQADYSCMILLLI